MTRPATRGNRPPRRRDARMQATRPAILAGVFIITVIVGPLAVASNRRNPGADSVGCSAMEQLRYHVHAHLTIYVAGQEVPVPSNIGIRPDCISWLHTHQANGVIHIEAPNSAAYTMGQFFEVWNQPLDATHLGDHVTDSQHQLIAYVNGQPFSGPPDTIPLIAHTVITLEYGPPFLVPPPYTFGPGE